MDHALLIEGITKSELAAFIQDAVKRIMDKKDSGLKDDRLYTAKETATYLKIHVNTLHTWKRTGKIKATKLNTRIRYKREDIEEAQKNHA